MCDPKMPGSSTVSLKVKFQICREADKSDLTNHRALGDRIELYPLTNRHLIDTHR